MIVLLCGGSAGSEFSVLPRRHSPLTPDSFSEERGERKREERKEEESGREKALKP